MAKYKLEGLDEVLKMLKNVETLPQKCVNKSARNGAKIAHTDAKGHAPFLTGALDAVRQPLRIQPSSHF